MQNLKIRKANFHDAKACANIHHQEIATGFLSQLGTRFLEVLYTAMVTSQHALCIVAEDEKGQVVGFVSGCFHVSKFYKEFIVKHGLKAFLILLPQIMKPVVLKKVFETAKYPSIATDTAKNVGENELPKAELLSIAVKPHVRGMGVSQKLTTALFDECKKRGIQRIKVVVGVENIRANKFYEKVGFELYSDIEVHESERSNVYVKEFVSGRVVSGEWQRGE